MKRVDIIPIMKKKVETQNREFKSNWRDEYLKAVCAFANSDGGTLFVGLDDNDNALV